MERQIRIELAEPADQAAILELALQQHAEHAIHILPEELARAIAAVLSDESLGFIVVARDDGRVAGMAYVAFTWSLEHCGRSAWLEELFVVPERRSRGIGTGLVQAAVERAAKSGCRAVDLEVDQSHSRAASLYRRSGFVPLARTRWARELSAGPA